jgi:hypothetical protein
MSSCIVVLTFKNCYWKHWELPGCIPTAAAVVTAGGGREVLLPQPGLHLPYLSVLSYSCTQKKIFLKQGLEFKNLHLDTLHQSYFCGRFFEIGSFPGWLRTLILLICLLSS